MSVATIFFLFFVFCRDKRIFVAAKDVFCRDKHLFLATKMIHVVAPAIDREVRTYSEVWMERRRKRRLALCTVIQRVMNCAARIVCKVPGREHFTHRSLPLD